MAIVPFTRMADGRPWGSWSLVAQSKRIAFDTLIP